MLCATVAHEGECPSVLSSDHGEIESRRQMSTGTSGEKKVERNYFIQYLTKPEIVNVKCKIEMFLSSFNGL